MVLGCAGTGKTTFARTLARMLAVPFVCLDEIWPQDWVTADLPKYRDAIACAHAGDAWVSDGNFATVTFDLRLPRAELIVWLEQPRILCAWRAVRRVFRRGESHRFRDLPRVLSFIWHFESERRPNIERLRQRIAGAVPVVRLSGHREIAAFLVGAARAGTLH